MLPAFLIPEQVVREDGKSPQFDVTSHAGKILQLTLGINRIIEQESLDVSVWGSADGSDWGSKPLVAFPQKFYCGTYSVLVDLGLHPSVKYVQVQWKTSRWGRGEPKPLFGLYLFAEEVEVQVLAAAN